MSPLGAFIKLEPTGTSTLSLGARVTFTCSRNTTQNSIGWIAVLASGESLYAEGNYEHFNELGLTIIMLNQTMSEIEFVPMNVNLSSLRCQYIQSSNAMPVMSNVAVLSIIGEWSKNGFMYKKKYCFSLPLITLG